MADLVVVAGEASGDRAAAGVIARLEGARVFGLGGPALARTGVELVSDLRASTALGFGEAGGRARQVFRAWRAILREVRDRRPTAALLVNYSEFNLRLAARLRSCGVRVLWYGPPQVWAWRARRVDDVGRRVDELALMLPFEEPLWRAAAVPARYVGHPALEASMLDREAARRTLRLPIDAEAVGILPGSRPHEVRRLLAPMLDAYDAVRARRPNVDARLLVAASLDAETRRWSLKAAAARGVQTFEVDPTAGAIEVLRAFDACVCASGTVTLEAALAGVPPVVAYRVGLATELAVRLLVRIPHVALPNLLLGRRAFTELLQRNARPGPIAAAIGAALDRRSELAAACEEVRSALGASHTPSATVAQMLAPWIGAGRCAA